MLLDSPKLKKKNNQSRLHQEGLTSHFHLDLKEICCVRDKEEEVGPEENKPTMDTKVSWNVTNSLPNDLKCRIVT